MRHTIYLYIFVVASLFCQAVFVFHFLLILCRRSEYSQFMCREIQQNFDVACHAKSWLHILQSSFAITMMSKCVIFSSLRPLKNTLIYINNIKCHICIFDDIIYPFHFIYLYLHVVCVCLHTNSFVVKNRSNWIMRKFVYNQFLEIIIQILILPQIDWFSANLFFLLTFFWLNNLQTDVFNRLTRRR